MLNCLPKDILIKLILTFQEELKCKKLEKKLSKIEKKKKSYEIANFANDNTEFNFYVCHYKDCNSTSSFESNQIGRNRLNDVCNKCNASYCKNHVKLCLKNNCCISCPSNEIVELEKNFNKYSKKELINLFINIGENMKKRYREGMYLYKRYKKYDELMYIFHNNHNFNIEECDFCDAFEINSTYFYKNKIVRLDYDIYYANSCEGCLKI